MTEKMERLDVLLVNAALAPSRHRAQALIGAGKVTVNGKRVDKAGLRFPPDAQLCVLAPVHPYVSRGGVKLAHALEEFSINPAGLTCMDIGASTGGFTDCLLQKGAAKVYAVDVGYGQLDWRLRQDSRVVVLERSNIRYLPQEAVAAPIDIITIDTSFISLRIVVASALKFATRTALVIALIKPQFEVGKGNVGKGGIVRNPVLHEEVLSDLTCYFEQELKLRVAGLTPSPILGTKGNREFLAILARTSENRGNF